jgi:hypothetical protein
MPRVQDPRSEDEDRIISRMSFAGVSVARARGVEYSASLQRVGDATWVTIDPGVGLGAGDNTDLYLRVDL